MESGCLTPASLFPGRLDTLIKCHLKNKWPLHDTLYRALKMGRRMLTIVEQLRQIQ